MRILFILLAITLAGCTGQTPVAELYNTEASTPAALPFNPFEWKVIGTFINTREHTMSTLYCNDSARRHADANLARWDYSHCDLALVTWQQKEDPHWYGANLPGAVKCVERVRYVNPAGSTLTGSYERYEGNPLTLAPETDPLLTLRRMAYIKSRPVSVMP